MYTLNLTRIGIENHLLEIPGFMKGRRDLGQVVKREREGEREG